MKLMNVCVYDVIMCARNVYVGIFGVWGYGVGERQGGAEG